MRLNIERKTDCGEIFEEVLCLLIIFFIHLFNVGKVR